MMIEPPVLRGEDGLPPPVTAFMTTSKSHPPHPEVERVGVPHRHGENPWRWRRRLSVPQCATPSSQRGPNGPVTDVGLDGHAGRPWPFDERLRPWRFYPNSTSDTGLDSMSSTDIDGDDVAPSLACLDPRAPAPVRAGHR